MAFIKFHFYFFQRVVILLGEIIQKENTCLLFFHENSIHEVSRRYLILEYHSCKIQVPKFKQKGNNSKNVQIIHFVINNTISLTAPFQTVAPRGGGGSLLPSSLKIML